jgi:SAM-dependent methyltransferase
MAKARIYGLEQVTPFAALLAELAPSFIGSEYLPDVASQARQPRVRHEDLMALTFPNDTFDLGFSNDVLEHVPDIDRGLAEMCRVLRPGGAFVSTVPFSYGSYTGIKKASLANGEIVHHTEPEYHGNPVDPHGSLVFEVPGWDILDRAKAAGFRESFVRVTRSRRHGYIGSEVPALFIVAMVK